LKAGNKQRRDTHAQIDYSKGKGARFFLKKKGVKKSGDQIYCTVVCKLENLKLLLKNASSTRTDYVYLTWRIVIFFIRAKTKVNSGEERRAQKLKHAGEKCHQIFLNVHNQVGFGIQKSRR